MPKELSLKEHCLEQLQRVNKLRGFPDNRLAIEDYCCALLVADTYEAVTRTMDEVVSMSESFCPSAATLRRIAYEQSEKNDFAGCADCQGTGWRHVIRGAYSGVTECACRKRVLV